MLEKNIETNRALVWSTISLARVLITWKSLIGASYWSLTMQANLNSSPWAGIE